MSEDLEPNFQALVFSADGTLAARCREAAARLPIEWTAVEDPRLASHYAGQSRFDFVVVEADSPHGASMLGAIGTSSNVRNVTLAVTSKPIDPDILHICYRSQFFYPVRPDQVEEQLCRAMPLAEKLSFQKQNELQFASAVEAANTEAPLNSVPEELLPEAPERRLGSGVLAFLRSILRTPHSLSVEWQERVASAIAASGAIWLVNEMTTGFRELQYLGPPPEGPTYLIAIAALLWLCAKQRRLSARAVSEFVCAAEDQTVQITDSY